MKGRYYFHFIWGCVDPQTQGPFDTFEEMEAAARKTYAEEGQETHAYFWSNLDAESFELNSFSNLGDKDEDEEDEES